MIPARRVRAQVAESWFRSAAAGVRADTVDASTGAAGASRCAAVPVPLLVQ